MLNGSRGPSSHTTPPGRRPRLVTIVALDGRDDSALLALAASLARGLQSPIAAAIVESAHEREMEIRPVEPFRHSAAMGVTAGVGQHTVVLGDAAVFEGLGLSVDNLGDWPERLRRRGQQVLFVAIDGRTAGFLGVAEGEV